jgi:hypothetical protein
MTNEEILSLVKGGQSVADVSGVVSVLSALATDSWTAVAAAAVSVGAILIPRCLDWYKSIREAGREQHRLDIESDTRVISSQAVKIGMLEAKIADLEAQLADYRCPFANHDGARCSADEPPGTWLQREAKPDGKTRPDHPAQ